MDFINNLAHEQILWGIIIVLGIICLCFFIAICWFERTADAIKSDLTEFMRDYNELNTKYKELESSLLGHANLYREELKNSAFWVKQANQYATNLNNANAENELWKKLSVKHFSTNEPEKFDEVVIELKKRFAELKKKHEHQ